MSEKDKEEEQKLENSAKLTLVTVLAFDNCCDNNRPFFEFPNNSAQRSYHRYRDDVSLLTLKQGYAGLIMVDCCECPLSFAIVIVRQK